MSEQQYTPPVPPAPAPKKDNKVQILAASFFGLAVAVLVLAIALPSSNKSDNSNAVSTPVSTPDVMPVNKYDSYYEYVLNESGRANSMSKSDVIKLGDLVCQAFDEGNSASAVINVMARASSDSSDVDLAAAALWGATEYLCPEYKAMVQAYLNN